MKAPRGWCPEPKARYTMLHARASHLDCSSSTCTPSRLGPAPGCAYRRQIRYRSRSDARSWRCVKARLAMWHKLPPSTQFYCPGLKSGSVKPWRPCAKKLKTSLNAVMSWPHQLGIHAAQLNDAQIACIPLRGPGQGIERAEAFKNETKRYLNSQTVPACLTCLFPAPAKRAPKLSWCSLLSCLPSVLSSNCCCCDGAVQLPSGLLATKDLFSLESGSAGLPTSSNPRPSRAYALQVPAS